MIIKTNYIGKYLELSEPVGRMKWNNAMGRSYPDGWRVPTRAELVTVFDEATDSGYVFDDMSVVWSSTSYALDPTDAWNVYFCNGNSNPYVKTNRYAIRLVREVKK